MPLCVPHETEGGPCHPKKKETNTTYWVADSKNTNKYFEVHWHKSESVPVVNWILTPFVKGIRANKGDITVDPYRILIKVGEPWHCIASAESHTNIIKDFKWLTSLVPRLQEEEKKLSKKFTATEIEDFIFPTILTQIIEETKKRYFKSDDESKDFLEWQKKLETIISSDSVIELEKLKNESEKLSKKEAEGDAILNHSTPTNILYQLSVERLKKLRRLKKRDNSTN